MDFSALEKNGLKDLLSNTARDIFLPDGIFYWSGRAKKEAEINATIGSAKGKTSHFLEGGDDTVKTFYLPSVIEAMRKLDSEQIAPYAPIAGAPAFREAWGKWVLDKLSPHYDFDGSLLCPPIVIPGATPGIAYLAKLFLSPGDTLLCHDRHWENYELMYEDCESLDIDTVPLFKGDGMDVEAFAAKVKELAAKNRNVVAVLNFPNNPSGYMPTIEEGKAMKDALVKAAGEIDGRIILIFDDAYEGYVFEDGVAPVSIFGHFIGAHPDIVAIKCDGATKEFLLYGGRVAAVTFAHHPEWGDKDAVFAALENKMKAFIRGTISNCNRAGQEAVAAALKDEAVIARERKAIVDVLADRYRVLKAALDKADLGGCAPDPFNSGFFCSLNVQVPPEELADKLLKEYKVGVIPMVNKKLGINAIRIAFCSVESSDIDEMVDRIAKAIRSF